MPSNDELHSVSRAAQELIRLQREIAAAEEHLKELHRRFFTQASEIVPDSLFMVGLSEILLETGHRIVVGNKARGSLPKEVEKRQAALDYLTEIGGGSLIKTQLQALGEMDRVTHLRELALRQGWAQEALDISSNVHPMTLGSFAKQRVEAGENIEPERLGIYVGPWASIRPPPRK